MGAAVHGGDELVIEALVSEENGTLRFHSCHGGIYIPRCRKQQILHHILTMARMTAGLDASGMPIALHVRLAGSSITISAINSRNIHSRALVSKFALR